jgi:hypothetical protein
MTGKEIIQNISMDLSKKQALENAIEQGNEYGYISWDGLLDLCDEDMNVGRYIIKELEKLKENNKIDFDISDLI